jgi:glycosyltransferase involved in cell wall biosynthesis
MIMSKVLVLYYSSYGHIEAMANARSSAATSVGGVTDLLGPPVPPDPQPVDAAVGYQLRERGVSVVSGDAEGFARGLARLSEDPGLRRELGRRGLEFVTQNYAKERLLRDMSALYSDLTLGTRTSRPH